MFMELVYECGYRNTVLAILLAQHLSVRVECRRKSRLVIRYQHFHTAYLIGKVIRYGFQQFVKSRTVLCGDHYRIFGRRQFIIELVALVENSDHGYFAATELRQQRKSCFCLLLGFRVGHVTDVQDYIRACRFFKR